MRRTTVTACLEASMCIYYRLFRVAYDRIEDRSGSLDTNANLPLEYVTDQLSKHFSSITYRFRVSLTILADR